MARGLPKEVEIKLLVDDLAILRRRLQDIGARAGAQDRGRVFEHNVLFDLPGHLLRKRGALLRLRRQMPASRAPDPADEPPMLRRTPGVARGRNARARKGPGPDENIPPHWKLSPGDAILTYKGRATARGRYKVADELEMAVDDPQRLTAILVAMGFRPSFRYEKFRTEFRVPKIPGLAVDLDETPIGNFVELEGPREAIDQAATLLGRGRGDYLTGSYASLYRQFCRRHGRPFGDMLFHRRKR